jgi:nucleotide sugar dehydrogenase
MYGIIGLGFVGGAISKSFQEKNVKIVGYDKYKNGGIGNFTDTLKCNMIYLCLPTLFQPEINQYDKSAIHEVLQKLQENNYKGLIILKSTVEPETTQKLSEQYSSLKLIHNPEFLTARTAYHDFHHQTHIVLGKGSNCNDEDISIVKKFYEKYYPKAEISVCTSLESESMKIFCNSFYASKIQLFNEYYLLCQSNGSNFDTIRNLMLKNNWINEMHTYIPGPDGNLSYGGACFPKDTNALCQYMKNQNTPYQVIDHVISERNSMRDHLYK